MNKPTPRDIPSLLLGENKARVLGVNLIFPVAVQCHMSKLVF